MSAEKSKKGPAKRRKYNDAVKAEALQSRSRRGNCDDNAHAESFWSRFKTELLDGGSFRNLTEARLEISQYLTYNNAERRHSARRYLAPNHFEAYC